MLSKCINIHIYAVAMLFIKCLHNTVDYTAETIPLMSICNGTGEDQLLQIICAIYCRPMYFSLSHNVYAGRAFYTLAV